MLNICLKSFCWFSLFTVLWVLDCLGKRTRSNLKTSLLGLENYDEHMSQLFLTFTVETDGIIRALKSVVGRHKQQRGTCLLQDSVCLHNDKAVYKKFADSDRQVKKCWDQRKTMQIKNHLNCQGESVWLEILPGFYQFIARHILGRRHIVNLTKKGQIAGRQSVISTSGMIKLVSIQLWFLWPLLVSEERIQSCRVWVVQHCT